MSEIFRKSFNGIELNKDKPGSLTAKFATLNVIDKDGDVLLPGLIENEKSILISAYQHGSWTGGLPVGKGNIYERDGALIMEGRLNLATESGKEHYEMMKFAPELQEWSFGFKVLEVDEESEWAQNPKVWRVLKKIEVFEVSPVLRGAGVDTRILAIKNDKQGLTLKEQGEAALAAADEMISRVKSLADLRRKEGRALSKTSREEISLLKSGIDNLLKEINGLLSNHSDAASESIRAELRRSLKTIKYIYGGK